jgi:hypothetical protein
MFPGTAVEESHFQPARASQTIIAFINGGVRLRLRETTASNDWFELARRQPFDSADKKLVHDLISVYTDVKNAAGNYLGELEDTIARTVVAKNLAAGNLLQQQTVSAILAIFSNWATQTYEGSRVSCGILVTTDNILSDAGFIFEKLAKEEFAKALSDGVDSWWVTSVDGSIQRFEIPTGNLGAPADEFYPLRYKEIALRASGTAIAITLNRNGEILVFADQRLQFAKRRGLWVHFDHHSVITQMSGGGAGAVALRRAIYESCLDASFARSGGCIGLLQHREIGGFNDQGIVSQDDYLDSSKLKPTAGRTLVANRSFADIPRAVRKEMMKLDGAIVLAPDGRIIAAGAILKLGQINLGNQGGRSAAAKTLSKFGLGIKISEDGIITGFKKLLGDSEPAFKVG